MGAMLAISTGEWIAIAIGSATLLLTVVYTVITYRIWTTPKTDMEIGDIVLTTDKRDMTTVIFKVSCLPSYGSFAVREVRCDVKSGHVRAALNGVVTHVGELLQGGHVLPFEFQASKLRLPKDQVVEMDMRIKLQDGSKKHWHRETRFSS